MENFTTFVPDKQPAADCSVLLSNEGHNDVIIT